MTTVDKWLFGIQAGEAAIACFAGFWAAAHIPSENLSKLFGAIGSLAGLYATIMASLVAGLIPTVGGITFLRGMSIIAWPLVWMAPPLMVVTAGPKFARRLVTQVAHNLAAHG